MRSRQAKGLQQSWLVVANNGWPDRIMEGRIQGEGVKVKGYQWRAMPRLAIISSKPSPGSAGCAFGQAGQLQKTAYAIFQVTVSMAPA